MQHERHGQRTAGFGRAQDVKRVGGCVFAQVALAGGPDEPGDAIVLGQCVQRAARGFLVHADSQKRVEPPGFSVEQPNLDGVVLEQVLGEVKNLRLQQVDAVLDRHLQQFLRREIAELQAGLVDRVEFLSLQDL